MMLGRETQMSAEVMFGCHSHESNETYGEYFCKLKERIQHAHYVTRTRLHDSAKRQKHFYDATMKANQYDTVVGN